MENKLNKQYSELPSWSRGIIAVAALGIAAIIAYKVYDTFSKSIEEKKDEELISAADTEINEWNKKGLKASFQPSDYLQYAESIHDAIDVCVGDDYSNAENILKKMKNNMDIALLIKAYGIRELFCFGIRSKTTGLFSAIRRELGAEWAGITSYRIDRINKDWKKKNITYQI